MDRTKIEWAQSTWEIDRQQAWPDRYYKENET